MSRQKRKEEKNLECLQVSSFCTLPEATAKSIFCWGYAVLTELTKPKRRKALAEQKKNNKNKIFSLT